MRDKSILTEQDVYYRLTTPNDINAEYDLMSQKYKNFVKENEDIRNISRQLNEDFMRFNEKFEYNEGVIRKEKFLATPGLLIRVFGL